MTGEREREKETYAARGNVAHLGALGLALHGGAGRGDGGEGSDDEGGEVHFGGWRLERGLVCVCVFVY